MPFARYNRYGSYRKAYWENLPGYREADEVQEQVFFRDHILCIGKLRLKLKREVLFTERIPIFALIQRGIFGDTEWRSSCPRELFEKCFQKAFEPAPA